jgi:hypothetical protein
MVGGKGLDRAKIEQAFQIMGEYLLDRKALGEIAIYGGSAIYPSPQRVGLRVVAAKPSYMLAMKLSAMERTTADDRDFEDAANLGLACGVRTVDDLRDVFRRFFPAQQLPASADVRLRELTQAIQSKAAR